MFIIEKEAFFVDNWKESLINEIKLKGYSKRTIGSYVFHVGKFLDSKLDPKEFLLKLINEGKSKETIRVAGFAVKFYLGIRAKQDGTINEIIEKTPNVKRDKRLPAVLSKKEIEDMVISTKNFIHRTMIQLMYSSGMRASEIISLKWPDIDFDRNTIHLKLAKGNKDRIVMLSPKVKKNLLKLDIEKQGLVFKTNRDGKYSLRSIELIVKKAAQKAGIRKKVTPHSLRHSFATHLLEQGVDVRYIRDLLGHANLQTTMIYTKVSNKDISKIKSPIDF